MSQSAQGSTLLGLLSADFSFSAVVHSKADQQEIAGVGLVDLNGKRDYVIIALLVGCALRRRELASLNIEEIQLREGRWVIIDLVGKGGRTVRWTFRYG